MATPLVPLSPPRPTPSHIQPYAPSELYRLCGHRGAARRGRETKRAASYTARLPYTAFWLGGAAGGGAGWCVVGAAEMEAAMRALLCDGAK